VALEIVRKVRGMDPPGRFLKKDREGRWCDVGNNEAREKTSQALRDTNANDPLLLLPEDGLGGEDDDDGAHNAYTANTSTSTSTAVKKKKHHRRKQTAPGRIQTDGLALGNMAALMDVNNMNACNGGMMAGGGMNMNGFAMPGGGSPGYPPHMNMNMGNPHAAAHHHHHHPMNMNMNAMNGMPHPHHPSMMMASPGGGVGNAAAMFPAMNMNGWPMPPVSPVTSFNNSASSPTHNGSNVSNTSGSVAVTNNSGTSDSSQQQKQQQQQQSKSSVLPLTTKSSSSNKNNKNSNAFAVRSHHGAPMPSPPPLSSSIAVVRSSTTSPSPLPGMDHKGAMPPSSPPKTKPKRRHSRKRTAPGRIQTDQLFAGIDIMDDPLEPIPVGSGADPLQHLPGSGDVIVSSPSSSFSNNGRSKASPTMTLPTTYEEDALHLLPDDWVPPKAAKISSEEPVLDDIYTASSKQRSRRRNRHARKITAPGRIETDQLFLGLDDLMNQELISSNLTGAMKPIPELPWKSSSAPLPDEHQRSTHRHRRCNSAGNVFHRSNLKSAGFSYNVQFVSIGW